jgi:CRP/FNR family transcriptional regulator, cyclic AMP receptor protein
MNSNSQTPETQIEDSVFTPGEALFREHDQTYHFFIIQEGQVEVFKTAKDGNRIPLATVGAGTSIGEFAMIDRLPRSATAVAKTTVRAAKVSESAYQELLSDLPEWAVSVMRAMVERLRQTNEIVRRIQSKSPDIAKEIELVEYDPDAGTYADSNPMLGEISNASQAKAKKPVLK